MSRISNILGAILTFEDASKQLDKARHLHKIAVAATTVFGASTVALSTIHINNYMQTLNRQEPVAIEQSDIGSQVVSSPVGSTAYLHVGVNLSDDKKSYVLNDLSCSYDFEVSTLNNLNIYETEEFNVYPSDNLPDINPKTDVDVYSVYLTKKAAYENLYDTLDDYIASEHQLDDILSRNMTDDHYELELSEGQKEISNIEERASGFTLVYEVSDKLDLADLYSLDEKLVGYLNSSEGTQVVRDLHVARPSLTNTFITKTLTDKDLQPCEPSEIDSSKNYLIVTVDNYGIYRRLCKGTLNLVKGYEDWEESVDYDAMEDAYLSVGYQFLN